ncbi:hypothetical protein T440DRAFT_477051 [Plenodomus tracheiphilus IPT5]|uniref:Uncharacterized protein n=1 Tax=Plenodomus tracheiphilus IPT5 TaxID=1408161 RepID=A0A6A7BCG6_9PLEO|nr:hypothetical protein T440DRAFT_477051 [Plenodomus tracheiphilus IPT5]
MQEFAVLGELEAQLTPEQGHIDAKSVTQEITETQTLSLAQPTPDGEIEQALKWMDAAILDESKLPQHLPHALTTADKNTLTAFLHRLVSEPATELVDLTTISAPKEHFGHLDLSDGLAQVSALSIDDKTALVDILNNVSSRNTSRRNSFDTELPPHHHEIVRFQEPDVSLEGLLAARFGVPIR